MNPIIRHRRLYAFYNSKVLNALMIVVIISFLLMGYTEIMLLPTLCACVAFILFVGYSLWIWVKKPKMVVISPRLSDISGLFTLYFVAIAAFEVENQWWYIVPVVCAIFALFYCLLKPKEEAFAI